jgi:hypothetical protein
MSAYYYALVAASKKVLFKIGDSTVSPTGNEPPSADRAWMTQFTCSKTATYTGARVQASSSGNAAGDHWKLIVYADNAGAPGNLVYASASTPNVGGNFAVTNFTISVALTNGTLYWIGVVSDSFNGNLGDIAGGSTVRCETLTFASPANNPTVAASASATLALDAFVYL